MSLIRIISSRCRLPAWLGILALLMLFIAPVISQTLAPACHHAATPATCTLEADTHSPMHGIPQPQEQESGHQAHEFHCGYCVLLLHSPALAASSPLLFWQLPTLTRPAPVVFISAVIIDIFPINTLPRAPPVDVPIDSTIISLPV